MHAHAVPVLTHPHQLGAERRRQFLVQQDQVEALALESQVYHPRHPFTSQMRLRIANFGLINPPSALRTPLQLTSRATSTAGTSS